MTDEKPTVSNQRRDDDPGTDFEDNSLMLKNVPHTVSESSMEATRHGRSSAPPKRVIKSSRSIFTELHESTATRLRDEDPDSNFPFDPPKTALPFDFTPEAKLRIRKRNAERRAKGLPLTTIAERGTFGATPLFPELQPKKGSDDNRE